MTTVAQSPSPNNIEINGRAWRVTDRETVADWLRCSRRVAEMYQHRGIVAKVQLLAPRGRQPYVAYQRQDGTYSRPWRGTLVVA